MNSSRVFIIISLLLCAGRASGCWYPDPQSIDNMIYRLTEDVSPYYMYSNNHSLLYSTDMNTETANLALWRKQTNTTISDKELRWYVYETSENELKARRKEAIKVFGRDGYRLLCIAKQCESFRKYINDPWYYPCKDDRRIKTIESRLREVKAYKGRYASRYALQAVRIMVALQKYQDAVGYWEKNSGQIGNDAVWNMAERHVARAYLLTGDSLAAAGIYARHGDLNSLLQCGLERDKVWEMVYENCPDSPFFPHELQFLLTHLDNGYLDREYGYCSTSNLGTDEPGIGEQKHIEAVIRLADRAIREKKVKDIAMWYYAKAALLDITGKKDQALQTAKAGQNVCRQGTFLASSMRVLRILIEAETCRYDSVYEARLLRDIRWMDMNGRSGITPGIRKLFERERGKNWDGSVCYYDVTFTNKYYWGDVMNRILVDVLSRRLKEEGHTTEALLYNNLGVFWVMKNVYGKADSPNESGPYTTTNLTNATINMADTCSAIDLVRMYRRIASPTLGIDSLVVMYGKSDPSFWHDMIGTHYIAEQKYSLAVKWLRNVSRQYQRSLSTWEYFDRDPFCYKIGWAGENRHRISDRYDYKLKFAIEMAALERMMRNARTADKRGEAMIRYGVGLRNQKEWCWSLSRYYDSSCFYYGMDKEAKPEWDIFVDVSDSRRMIDKGIATISDRELKASYLHLFVRNREVMKYYSDTQVAKDLRAHCDQWRDYARN